MDKIISSHEKGRASLGEILVRMGIITSEQLQEALPHCDPDQRNLLSLLVELGFAKEERLLKAVGERHHVPYFTTFKGILDPEVSRLMPQNMVRRLLVIPIRKVQGGILLATLNPVDVITMDTVAAQLGHKVLPVLTTRRNLFETINQVFGIDPVLSQGPALPRPADGEGGPEESATSVQIKVVARAPDVGLVMHTADDTSVIDIVDGMIAEAISTGASDLHLEPTSGAYRVRMRVDGMLRDTRAYPKDLETSIVARIKILSKLDITETRLPQDGHISVDYGGRGVDLRVSTLPIIYGEKVVLRVLDHMKSRKTLSDLGLPPEVARTFFKVIQRPLGLLLVTGPTGSGKTTTLYAGLGEINTPEKNIVTLEDPVEYRLLGINQMEVNERIHLTFAAGLRAILRQDPNVILVGEIRDHLTCEIAIQAAITGHMVFSTLHTKDAVGTVARLLNMNVEPFLLASALSGVLAQRLVRLLCTKCRVEAEPSPEVLARLGVSLKKEGPLYAAQGCDHCMGIGYKGRTPVYEWLVINRELRNMIIRGASADELKDGAKRAGMRSLQEDAMEKVYQGLTSIEEVVRVTHEEELEEQAEEEDGKQSGAP